MKRFFAFACFAAALTSSLHAGQLADRVFAYQGWTTLQADVVVDAFNDTQTSQMHFRLYRRNTGDFAFRNEQVKFYEVLADGHYSFLVGDKRLSDRVALGSQTEACLLTTLIALNGAMRDGCSITSENGLVLELGIPGLNPRLRMSVTADLSGKITGVQLGEFQLGQLEYGVDQLKNYVKRWTLVLPSLKLNHEDGTSFELNRHFDFHLENVLLDQPLPGDAFAIP